MVFLKNKDCINHNNNFNFLRLLLASLVLLSHSPELIDGNRHREILTRIFHTISFGELAVDGFFLLSGYLITQSWQRTPDLIVFSKKRILRIYPGFIAATFVCAFIVGPLGATVPNYFDHFNVLLLLKGILKLNDPIVPPVFVGQPYAAVNGAMWTIVYEFRCYVLVALFGIIGFINQRIAWLILSLVVITFATFPSLVSDIYFPGSANLIGMPSDFIHLLSFFSAGGCFYLFHDQIYYSDKRVLTVLPILIISLFEPHILRFVLPTIGAYVFFWFSFLDLPILQKFRTYSDISYGVYLYGWPTQKLLIWYVPLISPWLVFILSLGISFICGLVSWHLVEKPFLQLKSKIDV
jgi:peptidoglycan/LPS O-acetylase OafA/YrhL